MLSADVRVEGFDQRSWTHLISLFAPPVVTRMERAPLSSDAPELDAATDRQGAEGTLLLVVSEDQRVLKAVHTVRGRVKDLAWSASAPLSELAERYGARRVIVLRQGVVEEVQERVAARLHRDDDYLAQWLVVARAVRESMDAGAIQVWPRPFASMPIPTARVVWRAVDSVLPDEHAMVLAVWSGSRIWTAVALRRRRGEIDLVAGPDRIARWAGPLGGDWRRDHRIVADAVARHVAPVHVGIYGELESVEALLRSREAGAWARAVAVRDVIVHPTPPYVAVALGADAARAVASRSARRLGGVDALAMLAPVGTYLRGRVQEITSVTSTLGFDPLKALAAWLERADDARAGRAPHE